MARVISLGLRQPSAIPNLVAEGLLPPDPPESLYTWQVFNDQFIGGHSSDEEILYTADVVAWSRAGIVQRLFRFEIEQEAIAHVVCTSFFNNDDDDEEHVQEQGPFSRKGAVEKAPARHHGGSASGLGTVEDAATTRATQRQASSKNESFIDDSLESTSARDRAIVVILKTQIHVFFLQGTSHVVNLPFEIDAAFALPNGILLQRNVPEKPTVQSPILPSAPHSTFVASQLTDSHASSGLDEDDINSHFQRLLSSIRGDALQSQKVQTSRFVCLTDLFAPLAHVTTNTPGKATVRGERPGLLDSSEVLIYISPRDEIGVSILRRASSKPTILALTRHLETGLFTLWLASYTSSDRFEALRKSSSTEGKEKSLNRRRSSFMPHAPSGTSTPGRRSLVVPRESSGGAQDSQQKEGDDELASTLDPAFEVAGISHKASRRVSSLMARTELSTSRDRHNMAELAGSNPAKKRSRRGQSLGPYESQVSRSSFGSMLGNASHYDRAKSHPLNDSDTESMATEVPDGNSFRLNESPMPRLETISKDNFSTYGGLVFEKIHSFSGSATTTASFPSVNLKNKPKVFTLRHPQVQGKSKGSASITMCIIDPSHGVLRALEVEVHIKRGDSTKHAGREVLKKTRRSAGARVTDLKVGHGVLDACKVSDGECARILVLQHSPDGFGELSLQAPWTSLFKLRLPAKLALSHPFRISSDQTSGQLWRSSIKRVLSQGPKSLTGMICCAGDSEFTMMDEKNDKHWFEVQLTPKKSLVKRIIDICDFIMPSSHLGKEAMLNLWWSVMVWLESRNEQDDDREWSAMITALFAIGTGFLEQPSAQTTVAHRKRKSGPTRSSSGTAMDFSNWNAMMERELQTSTWLQQPAWQWATELSQSQMLNNAPQTASARQSRTTSTAQNVSNSILPKCSLLLDCVARARDFCQSSEGEAAFGKQGYFPTATTEDSEIRRLVLPTFLIGIHLYREELKLNVLSSTILTKLTPVLAQLGGWLKWKSWGWHEDSVYTKESSDMERWLFDESKISREWEVMQHIEPPSVFSHIESIYLGTNPQPFLNMLDVALSEEATIPGIESQPILRELTRRTVDVLDVLSYNGNPHAQLVAIEKLDISESLIETLPEGVAASLRSTISFCQADPSTSWSASTLNMIGRDDFLMLRGDQPQHRPMVESVPLLPGNESPRDVHTICQSSLEPENVAAQDVHVEVDRQSITGMVFSQDQRFGEASKLLHPLRDSVARCVPEADWSDTDLLEAQQELVRLIAIRTLSVSPGRGMLVYNARLPLLTEKFPIHGFTLKCLVKPANTHVTADKTVFTEDKYSWAFFHAGAEAGLSIAKDAQGIDTSWIQFNKPSELSNRHAGFLLALGLNGHLKSVKKWVAFKYLTPKHTLTSIGLLLGLAASYLGTTDTLITKVLSVHVVRMLPPGAAELNIKPLTQTAGIMGIGLLYCNTQHRRMSEIMISEIEDTTQEESQSPMEPLRDEGYRLAAGFALGYINLGQGNSLRGLHDMHLVERLLTLAVGTRKVDIVHILDKATAAATIAVALIFMKTHNEPVARKIDIPDTIHQFEYVRPDIFLLRTVARHLIMWDDIRATPAWISAHLPPPYRSRSQLTSVRSLQTQDMPLFNILAGLCLSIALRHAGSADTSVRSVLTHYLEQFTRIARLPALNYDGKLTRIAARNCQDTLALAAACVMAGTGDLRVFRLLRSLHGRADAHVPYGSHMATHLALGVLFLGGGTHTFGTGTLAVASLLCAFYPLFPPAVEDNRSHLQAFRHFWVLAAEARCLVVRDADSRQPVRMPITVVMRGGEERRLTAPCLLPELERVQGVRVAQPEFWPVELDLEGNPAHLAAFRAHQSLFVRRRAVRLVHGSVFGATMHALNGAAVASAAAAGHAGPSSVDGPDPLSWVFELDALKHLSRAERALVLGEGGLGLAKAMRGTAVDDRLGLEIAVRSGQSERLWSLRLLFAWAEGRRARGEEDGSGAAWIGDEVLRGLKAAVWMRGSGEAEGA